MKDKVESIADWTKDDLRLRSSYRRLAASHLPVNLYSAQAQMQRRAATLLHGIIDGTGSWEELDGRQLADDVRGDRTSLLLGGAAGGVAFTQPERYGLLAAAGTGTLFLTHVERLSPAARYILCRIVETGRFTPVGDPFPRPLNCRIILGSARPLSVLAKNYLIEWGLADALGHISLRAEKVIRVLAAEELLAEHPSSFAAAS
jgi:two-component system response regulator HupR/HoxA